MRYFLLLLSSTLCFGASPGSTYLQFSNNGVPTTVSNSNGLPISGSITAVNSSVSATGAAVPTSATFMGVQSGANLVGLSFGQALMAASLPVTLASNQSAIGVTGTFWQATQPVSAASLPLPSGAATSALQTALNGQIPATLGAHVTTASLAVNIASDQVVPVSATSLPLPTGAATSALQTTGNTALTTINTTLGTPFQAGGALGAGTALIGGTTQAGSAGVSNAPVYNVYSVTNVTTSAYVQLIASTTSATNYIDIFDSSGQAMILATGGSGSEVVLAYIPPGGDQVRVQIPASTRVAYKALTATANSGYLLLNLWK
jgi:hypothetical protein